jgi:hypothetical protein
MGRELVSRWRAAVTGRMGTVVVFSSIASPNDLRNQVAHIFIFRANPYLLKGIEHPLTKCRTPVVADLQQTSGLCLNSFSGSSTRECP